MARANLSATLKRTTAVTPTMRELIIELDDPQGFKYQTGQFMMIHVPGQEKPVKRAYSIASDDHETKGFSLILKLVPGGLCSEYVKGLKDGAKMEVSGPFGKCFFQTPAPEQVIFMSTGAGLSQHYSMLLSQGPSAPNTQFHLLLGVWNESEVFYQKELESLRSKVKNFTFDYVLDKADPSWKGKTGFVTNYLKDYDLKIPTKVYLCGNPAMIKGAKQWLIEEHAFPKENVIAESFG